MKSSFLLPLAAAACFLSPARAALNPAIVPADAGWILHADFDALRTSQVGRELIGALHDSQFTEGNNPVQLNFEKAFALVHSATAYGANFSPHAEQLDGVLVIEGAPDLRKIAESILLQAMLAKPEQFSELKDLPFPAYAVEAKGPAAANNAGGSSNASPTAKADSVIIAFPPEPIVVISKSRAQLLRARDAFRGSTPNLAAAKDARLSDLVRASQGAFVFITSVVPGEKLFENDNAPARILKLTRSGSVAIGEEGPRTFLRAQIVASDSTAADKTMKILQGITAMLSLKETTDQQLAEFLNSASVTREGDVVNLRFAYASERLTKLVQTLITHRGPPSETTEKPEQERFADLINGEAIDRWTAVASKPAEPGAQPALEWRTISNVTLKNGTIVSLGRHRRNGRSVRFDRVEVIPANGGAPLSFDTKFMTRGGPRDAFTLFQFPGTDGTYTLKVAYTNDPLGKAEYAVSVRHPSAAAADGSTPPHS